MTVVTRSESVKLRQIVSSLDKDAFVYSMPISEAMGYGFLPLTNENKRPKSKNKESNNQIIDVKSQEILDENANNKDNI